MASRPSPTSRAASAAPAQVAAPALPVLPFDDAVLSAANDLFNSAQLPPAGPEPSARHTLVVDPLIDGVTGFQVTATRSMQSRIVNLVRTEYPRFEVREFTRATIAEGPLVLLGSLAGIDGQGEVTPQPEIYRIWLVLADLKSGAIVGKATARAAVAGVDLTPAAFFRDSPAWTDDRYTEAYLKTCGGKVGDRIDPVYLDGILTAALVGSAIEAYDAGRYGEALDLYESAASTPTGDQLRVHSGIYLANWQLGRQDEAAEAFGQIVDYGLRNGRLAVKFLFNPGSTRFWSDPEVSGPYSLWLEQIAHLVARDRACLEITGHTSPSGPAPLNERLSFLRAEYVRSRLESEAPPLGGRTITNGVGSREAIIGTGADDATDVLDRRVEFKIIAC
jgi:outer membrane protein OmpA-like peptidoglycan-associated protein